MSQLCQAATTATPSMPNKRHPRELNDALRQHGIGGRFVMTAAVSHLPQDEVVAILRAIVSFNDFTTDNDPYGERDFGVVEVGIHRLFWKIDDLSGESIDLGRVLTVMFADEY